jgi:cholesterol oxidase
MLPFVPPSSRPRPEDGWDADFLVIGSGFGGSVSAMRLAEKGYKVIVLEAGRRFRKEDFPATNRAFWKHLYLPALGLRGILKMTLLSDVLVLSGAGVGGGSLVYANTLLRPHDAFYEDPTWSSLSDWKAALAPFYAVAERMLGVTRTPDVGAGDRVLKAVAERMGRGDTWKHTDVAVFFGEAGVEVPDPYFDGLGPARSGCNRCGGCMVGCRFGAKNTLDRNYLHFAEAWGADVVPDTRAVDIRPDGPGYVVDTERTDRPWGGGRRTYRARRVVVSAGVLGSLDLLMACKERGSLPGLSGRLGAVVRTNSEAIIGVKARADGENQSVGIAIASGFHPEEQTHVEVVRYSDGSDLLAPLATLMADGGPGMPRQIRYLLTVLRHPLQFLSTLWPFGWAKRTIILLVMQSVPNFLMARRARRWFWPFGKGLVTEPGPGQVRPPSYIPVAHQVARELAKDVDGIPCGAYNEALLDIPTTAHILGGCCIGADAESGVVDAGCRVFGHDGLYVIDGSMIPANLGVNPSLTIAALAEHAMAQVPPKAHDRREPGYWADRL